jgi:sortase A
MRDKRAVDELSIEELERVLAIRKREARMTHIQRMKKEGRVIDPTAQPSNGRPVPPPAHNLPPELADSVEPAERHLRQTESKPAPVPVAPPATFAPAFEDDIADVEQSIRRHNPEADRAWRRFINGSLFLVELAAVVGIFVIAVALLSARNDLQETTRQEQANSEATRVAALPTLEPTPILKVDVHDWVLPGGHTSEGGQPVVNITELNEAGIPASLLPRVQTKLITPVIDRPERTPETAMAVNIPELGLEATIVQGADWEALKLGVGQVLNNANPGDPTGNVVLAAHNDIYGELFRELDQLEAGDRFTIRTEQNVYEYEVTGWEVVEPTAVEVMQNTGIPTATLISCYPLGINDKRIVVYAERVG